MSEANSSSPPNSCVESTDRAESYSPELDLELEELCRAQDRNLAAVAALRLFIPLLFIAVLLAIGAWAYIQFATTRNEIRAKTEGDPTKAMELLIRASGKDANSEDLFSSGNFDPSDFDSRSFQIPNLDNPKKRN